ncbi:MAG: 6-phosphogluconolactonase, partial [Terriglobia bacterium]
MNPSKKFSRRSSEHVVEPPEPGAVKLKLHVFRNAEIAAQQAATLIAEQAQWTVELRGRFVLALSGGETPRQMLKKLATEDMPWAALRVVQVDERVAPAGNAARNLALLQAN